MATNKPYGDNARKGSRKKAIATQDRGNGQEALDQAQSDDGRVYVPKEAGCEEVQRGSA